MTEAELQAFAASRLGTMHGSVRRQLQALAEGLRADERLVAVAVAVRGVLMGGSCVIAATDQRLLLVWSPSSCEEIGYDALVSVTDDRAARELSLVTRDRVHTLTLAPTPGAAELVAALTARVGADRVHARAGGAEARRARQAIAAGVVTACMMVGGFVLRGALETLSDRAAERAPSRLEQGACVDVEGHASRCEAVGALFYVRGPRQARDCPRSSVELVRSLATNSADRRALSRWCVDLRRP